MKSGISQFLTKVGFEPGKHRVSSRSGFESLTVAHLPTTSGTDFFEVSLSPRFRNALPDSSDALLFPGSRQFVPSAWRFGGLLIIYISKFTVQKYGTAYASIPMDCKIAVSGIM
jgi:hypothetical protein